MTPLNGIDLLLAFVVVLAIIHRRHLIAVADACMPDTERRRIQCLVLSGLRTIEREKRRKIRGEETEGL